jgi:ankyrin repeat protein
MMELRLNLETVTMVTTQSSQDQMALQYQLRSGLTSVDERIARVEEMLRAQADQARESQLRQVGPLYNVSAVRRRVSPARREVSTSSTQSEGVGVRVAPYSVACRPGCTCACHSQQRASSPGTLSHVLGQLFIGYAGLPYFSPKCNIKTCRTSHASKISIEYWFPLGFVSSTILRMQAGYCPSTGTLFQLQTLRTVPDNAQCVNFALNGNIEGLKYLFSNGLASPRDVSSARGYTLLRWALYGKQYETCEFLVHAGVDADYRPLATSDNSPRIKACHFLLEGGLPDAGVDALRLIAKGGHHENFIAESGFTQTHRIVLGLSFQSLEEELILHPEDIDMQDVMGRTPLAWAAARGDTHAVVTLLGHGADPNIIDVQISGPVSNAAARGHTACVRLLLEAGAHPDPPVPHGVKKGSPLNVAARNATEVLLLKTLLDFGADIESSGMDGLTALIHVSRNDNASFTLLLLEYGADVNATSVTGATPLTAAITHNSHNVLRLILDRWQEYSDCPRLQAPNLIQVVALYADIETIQILATMDHLQVRHDKAYAIDDFDTRLRQRPDFTEKLTFAFSELLDVVNGDPDPRKCLESLVKSGFMP